MASDWLDFSGFIKGQALGKISKVPFKEFCPPVKTSCPAIEKVNEFPGGNMWHLHFYKCDTKIFLICWCSFKPLYRHPATNSPQLLSHPQKDMISKHERALLAASPTLRTSKRASSLHGNPYSKNKKESNLPLRGATLGTGKKVSFVPLSPTARDTYCKSWQENQLLPSTTCSNGW